MTRTARSAKAAKADSKARPDERAAALKGGKKPGPKESPVQVRNAGKEALADTSAEWDEQDEAVDETFPASDATAKY